MPGQRRAFESLVRSQLGDPGVVLDRQLDRSTGLVEVRLGSVAIGFASLLGTALGSLALLDPALVGVLESRSEPGQADWFIIAKWYH